LHLFIFSNGVRTESLPYLSATEDFHLPGSVLHHSDHPADHVNALDLLAEFLNLLANGIELFAHFASCPAGIFGQFGSNSAGVFDGRCSCGV
jgi:hypothetical protein